ncbi:sugar transferase [Anaerolinea sp.]|uniref:sugar transferase n=1 Tax=Anaerolinea sp. TaxID=1872519 RepID=UPI002ACD7D94|nr:sugar transferase [Anaerolinea sp.]
MASTTQKNGMVAPPKLQFRILHNISTPRQKYQWTGLKITLILLDAIAISLGFLVAYLIRFELKLPIFYSMEESVSLHFYLSLGIILLPLWLGIFALHGLYSRPNLLGGTKEYSLLFNATTISMFLIITANFLIPEFILARGWLLLTWVFVFLFSFTARFLLRRLVYFLRKHGMFTSNAVIVGTNAEAQLLATQFKSADTSGLNVAGYIACPSSSSRAVPDENILGDLKEIEKIVYEKNVEEIIVTSSAVSAQEVVALFKLFGIAEGVNLRLSSGVYEIITTGLQVQEIASVPLVKVNKIRLTGWDQALKFLLDFGLSAILLPFIFPVGLAIALCIAMDSKGPVFHRRRVMGVNGHTFDAFKFRTMYVNGDAILDAYPELKEQLAREHKLKNDPRVTRVGRFLRKTSLDELPQILNVLKGEMSLVGPRMISPEEMEKYQEHGMNLLTVKPGITGLWQVSGRSDVSYDQRVQMDMYYIRNWSIWLDLQILFRTIPAVLSRKGAY